MMTTALHKGYVPTRGKKCLMAFKGRTSEQLLTLEQVARLDEYAGILADGVVLIDIDDYDESEILMRIVEDLQLACRVYETSRGKHFLFCNGGRHDRCTTHAKTAIGLTCDVKLGDKNSYSVLKYNGKERPIIYDIEDGEEYDEVPKWLSIVKGDAGFVGMEKGEGRNQAFFNYILRLQSNGFSREEARECIGIINRYIVKDPLDNRELETVLRDESFKKPIFFEKQTFLHDKFAQYLMSEHRIIKINGQLHIYKDGVYRLGYGDIENRMIQHIPNLTRAKRQEVLSYLDVLIRESTRPSDAKYIAFRNGVLNIEDGSFGGFSPDIVITNLIEHDYNPNAYSEICDRTLDRLSVGDPQIRALLEEVVGYCLYRRNELRKSFILIGDKANGKSTYLDMVKTLLGDANTSALDLKELGDRFKTAELFGKLANIGDDIGDEFIANPAIFKKAVSGDRINAERKGQDPFDFNSYAKLLFSANAIPRIRDKSGAVMDRLIIVPFDARFSKDDADFDPYIKYKLQSEEVMEYLVRLGLDGLRRVLANRGFTTSPRVAKELEEYEESNNPMLTMLKGLSPDDFVNQPTGAMYRRYSEFCIVNNFQPVSNIEFSKQIKKRYGLDIAVRRIRGEVIRVFVRP